MKHLKLFEAFSEKDIDDICKEYVDIVIANQFFKLCCWPRSEHKSGPFGYATVFGQIQQ